MAGFLARRCRQPEKVLHELGEMSGHDGGSGKKVQNPPTLSGRSA